MTERAQSSSNIMANESSAGSVLRCSRVSLNTSCSMYKIKNSRPARGGKHLSSLIYYFIYSLS